MDPHLLSHGPSAHAPVVLPARLTFSDLTDGQVAHAFDFLPLVQHAWKQMEHAGGMASAGEDAKAVHMAVRPRTNDDTRERAIHAPGSFGL